MRINKNKMILLISLSMLLSPIFMIPSVYSAEIQGTDVPKSSQMLSAPIRIAIYDDANTSVPSYSPGVTLTNNYSNIQIALLAAGYEVTPLTTNQIYNHELKTARYDIFIMADHMPKTNITNFVKEYWLGGGALLSMDSALSFICYAGILPPESAGDHGLGIYWNYIDSTVQNITTRHPVSRSYQVNDTFTISNPTNSATPDWVALQGTSIASELVKIATLPGYPDDASVIAYDPQSGGGKVVHMVNHRDLEDDAILIDVIEWLCPRPKARILFDLSHLPYYGMDSWDNFASSVNYGVWRNNLVSRGYSIDKLYPSATGNLTSNNLLPYDMLIICMPEYNFTSSEVSSVTQWVNDGGGLIAIGENVNFIDENNNINYLYGSYDLQMVSVTGTNGATYIVEHPTVEGVTEISANAPGSITYSGDAFPILGYDATEIYVAGQEYGNGRVLLMSEVGPFRDSDINNVDNLQYAINVANWLTASEANVLLYVDEPDSLNYYRTPVSNALNELGINFYLTFDDEYTNLSLNLYDWELLIIDNPWYIPDASVLTTVNNFVKGGDRLIMSTYYVDSFPTHPLWARLGFAYDDEQPDSSSLYIWDTTHAIFNLPVDYGANRFDPIRDYNDEGDLLRVYPNATLFNGYLIDQFTGDLDDSTYSDNFELWVNEIAFMWAQIQVQAETPPPGIPGYDMFIVLSSIFLTMGLIAIITIRKKHI
ncbi:MAG: hypothetical protein ACTSP9_03330 [Promethearchaeota archaeon]